MIKYLVNYGINLIRSTQIQKIKLSSQNISNKYPDIENNIMKRLLISNRLYLRFGFIFVGTICVSCYYYKNEIINYFGNQFGNILEHKKVYEQTSILTKETIDTLSNDDNTINNLTKVISYALSSDEIKQDASNLVESLYEDDNFIKLSQIFVQKVLDDDDIQLKVQTILTNAVNEVLNDKNIKQEAEKTSYLIIKNALWKLLPFT